jgi:hypothetical protein
MAEGKKEFPWVQLIATIGTIVAALIGITPYILKLNTSSAPQTPTIVILTLPPAVTTPAPVTTPLTTVETTPVTTQTTVVTTIPTTGPPPTGNETTVPTVVNTTAVTTAATTIPATTATTLPPGPSIQISVNTTSVPQGGFVLASGSTDPAVPQVTITLKNSTTFQSAAVPVTLTQGVFQFQIDTSAYAPGNYTIFAAVPDTQAVASASFVITAA